MTEPPIFARLVADGWAYHHHQTTDLEEIMSVLTDIEKEIREHGEGMIADLRRLLDGRVASLGEVAQAVDGSRLVQLAMELAGTMSPEAETVMVNVLNALAGRAPAPVGTAPPEQAPAPA